MILMIVRDLLLLFLITIFIYGIYKIGRRIFIKEKVNIAVQDIKETLNTAKQIPKVNEDELLKAKKKINKTLKEGED